MGVVLASASPRRRELLALLIREFRCQAPDLDETVEEGESPEDYVLRLALAKARAVGSQRDTVIAADTSVTLDGLILGKPTDYADAKQMLMSLSGRTHAVVTGLAVGQGDGLEGRVVKTRVQFAQLSESEIDRYLSTDEPWDKAGAYAIQGRAGAFVREIDGSYSSVVGLPLCETKELLAAFGVTALL